jgi:hypothetical protein
MTLVKKYSAQVEKFLAACGKLASNLYVTSCGGNLAWKLEEDLLLITPTKITRETSFRRIWFLSTWRGRWSKGVTGLVGKRPCISSSFK